MVFQGETSFIHVLEDFRGAFEEKLAKLGCAIVGQKAHGAPSIF
jgi:hypothetical protein